MEHQIKANTINPGKSFLPWLKKLSVSDQTTGRLLAATIFAQWALLVFEVLLHPLRIGHDQALHYQMGLLLLEGKVPFVDMYDSNPPLIYYIDTIPGVAARIFHIHPILSFQLFICLLCGASCAAVFWLTVRFARRRYVIPMLVMTSFYALFNLLLGIDFGQREHICILAYVPFLIFRWLRWSNTKLSNRLSVTLGIVAGLGICLKHYFLLVAFAVELYWLCKYKQPKKLLAPECVSAFMVGVVYLLHFLVVPAEMRDGYFKYMVPIYTYGYSFWDTTLIFLFDSFSNRAVFLTLPPVCMAAVALARRHTLLIPLIVYTMAGLAIFAIQYKGWLYHAFPCMSGIVLTGGLAVGVLLISSNRARSGPRNLAVVLAALAALTVVAKQAQEVKAHVDKQEKFDLAQVGYSGTTPMEDMNGYDQVILKYTKVGDPILFFCNAVRPAFPTTLQLMRRPGSRFLHAIPLSLFGYIADTYKGNEVIGGVRIFGHQFGGTEASKLLQLKPYMMNQYEEDIAKFRRN